MIWALAAALAAVFVLSAFFSGSETAFMSVSFHRLRAEGSARARAVRRLAAHPERFLGAVLTGNVFANALVGVLLTTALLAGAETVEERARAAVLATLATSAGLLVLGEMVPKSIAARHAERWTLLLVRPVQALLWLLGPIAAALSWIVESLLRLFGIPRPSREKALSVAEMKEILQVSAGDAESDRKRLLARLVDATGRRLTEVMTPRRDIRWIPGDASFARVAELFREHGHTRMPVAGRGLDEVLGVLDLRAALRAGPRGFSLAGRLEPARFLPDTATLSQALLQMRRRSSRLLLVVDEHGGIEGLVTAPSLLDAVSAPGAGEISRAADGAYLLDGALTVSEANAALRPPTVSEESPAPPPLEIPPGDDYDTVAGFVLHRLGRIPEEGEGFTIPGGALRVERVERHRIARLRLTPDGRPATPSAAPAADSGPSADVP